MTIAQATLYRYRLPLSRTLILKGEPHIFRVGLIIKLADTTGHVGWGEIAPLPGFSRETLEQAQDQAKEILPHIKAVDPKDITGSLSALHAAGIDNLHASVQCGLEMALLHLSAEIQTTSVACLLGGSTTEVPFNGLLMSRVDEVLSQIPSLVSQGFRAIKLKVGTRSLDDDIALVYRVHARLGGKAALRLDANRAWTFEQAVHFGEMVKACAIEYIEEPLQDPAQLARLGKTWALPLALDESLLDLTPESLHPIYHLRAIIIKPTLIGGFSRAMAFAEKAKELELKAIISSSFESALGLVHLAHLSSAAAPDIPAGLSTADWFKENLLERPLPITSGTLRLTAEQTLPSDVRTKLLTEVARA